MINREARAKVIAAEGEMKSARALKEAADTMCESPAALQLRYLQVSFHRWKELFYSEFLISSSTDYITLFIFLQTLNSIAAEKNSTIIFPLPIDLISPLLSLIKKWLWKHLHNSQQRRRKAEQRAYMWNK